MSSPGTPTEAGFVEFIRNIMRINTTVLPDNSETIPFVYEFSLATVNRALACIPAPFYKVAVYNLGGDLLVNFAQDQDGSTYFADLREKFHTFDFVAGVIQSAADESTSDALLVPDFLKNLTLSDLQNLKTPWGRIYLSIAQKYGPSIWGLS
jgi:hypothetical protein